MKKLTKLQFLHEMHKVDGTQYGSTPGGIHIDDENDNKKLYVKYYGMRGTPNQAYAEVAAANIYELLDAKTVKPKLIKYEGHKAVASEWDEDLENLHPLDFDKFSLDEDYDLAKHYIAAVLTKNWDSVGQDFDNIRRNKKTGRLVTVDTGGTFNFRAMGGNKDFSTDATELKSLRYNNKPSGIVFTALFKRHKNEKEFLRPILELLKSIPNSKFKEAIKVSKIQNYKELTDILLMRKKEILNFYDI